MYIHIHIHTYTQIVHFDQGKGLITDTYIPYINIHNIHTYTHTYTHRLFSSITIRA